MGNSNSSEDSKKRASCTYTKVAVNSRFSAPSLLGVLAKVFYVEDLARASEFYEHMFGLPLMHDDDRMRAYDVNDRSVLLLFLRGGTEKPVQTGGGLIPELDGQGQLQMAFACTHEALQLWKDHLAECGVVVEGTYHWKRGGHSLYFRDPDGNLLELAAKPGLWPSF